MPPSNKQTLKQAKADYKKYGPRMSEKEQRQLERGIELDRRAEEIKERERRRKDAAKKRREKEEREKEIRGRMGVGLATQLAGFNHTQKQLKGAMESFLGLGKNKQQAVRDNSVADASAEALPRCDGLLDGVEDYWKSSPLEASVHSQDALVKGECRAGPALCSPEKSPGNLVHRSPQTRAGQASTTTQSVTSPMREPGETSSNTPCGHQDVVQGDAPGAKSSQSELWDDTLDDATILSALKGKTPTSQAAGQSSQVPTPLLHEPASPCERVRSESEPVHLNFGRTRHCSSKIHSLTQVDDHLAAIDIDCLDDLFPSNSQIQRELTPPRPPQFEKLVTNFIDDDLAAEKGREIQLSSRAAQPALVPASRHRPQQQSPQPHESPPFHVKSTLDPRRLDDTKQPRPNGSSPGPYKPTLDPSTHTSTAQSRPSPLAPSKNAANIHKTPAHNLDDAIMPRPQGISNISATFPKQSTNPGSKKPAPALPCSKRKIHDERASLPLPPVKKRSAHSGESRPLPRVSPSASAAASRLWMHPDLRSTTTLTLTTPSRFRDFGFSTQIISDALEDDDTGLSP